MMRFPNPSFDTATNNDDPFGVPNVTEYQLLSAAETLEVHTEPGGVFEMAARDVCDPVGVPLGVGSGDDVNVLELDGVSDVLTELDNVVANDADGVLVASLEAESEDEGDNDFSAERSKLQHRLALMSQPKFPLASRMALPHGCAKTSQRSPPIPPVPPITKTS
jgi:hypothetical protein